MTRKNYGRWSPQTTDYIKQKILSRCERGDSGCLLYSYPINIHGYGTIGFRGRTARVHRLMWEIENGPIPDGMLVCHKCDVRSCCDINHLFIGFPKDNTLDMLSKGRHVYPGNFAVLTASDVLEIRTAWRWTKESAKITGRRYEVQKECILEARSGHSWKSIPMLGGPIGSHEARYILGHQEAFLNPDYAALTPPTPSPNP